MAGRPACAVVLSGDRSSCGGRCLCLGLAGALGQVTTLLFALPASRYGEKDKPKALGLGLLLTGVGSIVFAFPQFVGSQYETDADATEELCMEVLNLSGEAQLCSNFEDGTHPKCRAPCRPAPSFGAQVR